MLPILKVTKRVVLEVGRGEVFGRSAIIQHNNHT
jgi:hypothetical protein